MGFVLHAQRASGRLLHSVFSGQMQSARSELVWLWASKFVFAMVAAEQIAGVRAVTPAIKVLQAPVGAVLAKRAVGHCGRLSGMHRVASAGLSENCFAINA